ncbi:MAG: hypothetical protein AAFN93_11265 [Bacteroidota bacterium]
MKTLPLLLFISVMIISCTPERGKEVQTDESNPTSSLVEDNQNALIGEWYNLTLNVVMDMDTDSVLTVAEGKWREVLGINPIKTTFKKDGTYVSIYEDLEGQPFMTRNGTWSIIGDSLTMEERGVATAYKFSIEDGIATFSADLDWNEDGIIDQYAGTQKRMSAQQD